MPRIDSSKRKKYFLLSAVFACASLTGVLVGGKSLTAQIKNNYFEDASQVSGLNSLMSAVASNDLAGVRFFSKAGASLINQKNIGGATALHIASREGNYEIVELLITNGAEVNVSDNEGWTPLMRASLGGHAEIVELLLSKNANASLLNIVNESAIIHAASSDCESCLNLMFEKFNFIKTMDTEILKAQLNNAFAIARNRENEEAQQLIEKYLDQVIKLSVLNDPQAPQIEEELGATPITQESDLNLITKNKGNFVEKNLSQDSKKSKNKFAFKGEVISAQNPEKEIVQPTEVIPAPQVSKPAKITDEKSVKKFVLISKGKDESTAKTTSAPEFKANDSSAVFLKNSKIGDKTVKEILQSKKFKFSSGAAAVETNKVESNESKNPVKKPDDSSSTVPPMVNSFKLMQGPKGQEIENKEQPKDTKLSTENASKMKQKANGFKLITGPASTN